MMFRYYLFAACYLLHAHIATVLHFTEIVHGEKPKKPLFYVGFCSVNARSGEEQAIGAFRKLTDKDSPR